MRQSRPHTPSLSPATSAVTQLLALPLLLASLAACEREPLERRAAQKCLLAPSVHAAVVAAWRSEVGPDLPPPASNAAAADAGFQTKAAPSAQALPLPSSAPGALRVEASDTWARVTDRGRFERGLLERTGAGWVLRARWPVGDLSGSLTTDSAAAQALREGWRSASTARPRHCASADDRASAEDAGERALGARPRAYRTGEGGLALLRGGRHGLCAIARAQPLGEWRVMKVFSPGAAPKLETSLRWPDEPAALAELVAGSAGDRPIERIELLDLGVFIRRYCR